MPVSYTHLDVYKRQPLLIAGSIFLLIANFPIPAWTEWLSSVVINSNTGETLAAFIEKPSGATFTIMAVFAVVGIAYSFARQMKTDKIFGAAVAIMGWFLIMPYTVEGTVEMAGKEIQMCIRDRSETSAILSPFLAAKRHLS